MNDIQYPLYKDPLFSKAKKIADYEKLKSLHLSVCEMIENIGEKVEVHSRPRNPRQDMMQRSNKNNIRVLHQRKIRIEERMVVLEESIRKDIESEK